MENNKKLWVDLDDIVLWDENPNEGDIGIIYIMIEKFGFRDPIGLWENNITKRGNHRTIALRQLRDAGWQPKRSPCLKVEGDNWLVEYVPDDDLDEKESNAFGVGHNQSTRRGRDDPEKLTTLLEQLAKHDRDMFLATGHDDDSLDELLRELMLPDDFPEYNESVENDVEYITCPHCEKEFPK